MASNNHGESSVSPHNSWIHRRAKSSIPYTNAAMLAQKLVAQQMSAYVYHQLLQQHHQEHHQLAYLDTPSPVQSGARSLELCRYRLPKVTSTAPGVSEYHGANAMTLRRSSTTVSDVSYGRSATSGSRGRRSTGDSTPTGSDSALDRATAGHMVARAITNATTHDRVILSESASHPDVPVAHRNPEERSSNPDRLSLDRRGLTVCPILEGEDNLRLLNYQHNLISRIQHLSSLRKLIFLDLYDNRIEAISGLSSLKSLRVLMLGKNRISKIEGLDALLKLDVLDLHGNEITDLSNIAHLSELRVLNLAGNQLTHVRNLRGLNALNELNLRRNRIRTVEEVDMLPHLQRLFLSFNEISSWQSVSCLADATSIVELSLDGNPISRETQYKQSIIRNLPQLKQLDMKRISEEERRIAAAVARKEEDRRKETSKTAALKMEFLFKEKRRLAITNARRQWESMQASLLARGTVPSGLAGPPGSLARSGRAPPELYATHVTTVCLPRPQSASQSAASAREERRARADAGAQDDEPPSRPRSGRCSRPGSARATVAMATVTALPSGVSGAASGPGPGAFGDHEAAGEPDTPSLTTHDSGFESCSKTTSVCDQEEAPGADREPRILSLSFGRGRRARPDHRETSESNILSPPGSRVSSCHLAEVQGGDQLHLYASGSLEALDRQWGLQAAGQIHTVRFSFVDFEEVARHLHKVRARFPAVQALVFQSTNIHALAQLNALASLRRLERLSIEEGNPVTQFALWRPFLLFRLAHLGLRAVNGAEVRPGEVLAAERLFSPLSHMTTSQLSQAHLLSLLTEARRKQQQQQAAMQAAAGQAALPGGPELAVGKLGLVYAPQEQREARQQAATAKAALAGDLLRRIVGDSVSAEDNREALARAWPRLLRSLLSRAAADCLATAAPAAARREEVGARR